MFCGNTLMKLHFFFSAINVCRFPKYSVGSAIYSYMLYLPLNFIFIITWTNKESPILERIWCTLSFFSISLSLASRFLEEQSLVNNFCPFLSILRLSSLKSWLPFPSDLQLRPSIMSSSALLCYFFHLELLCVFFRLSTQLVPNIDLWTFN